MSVDYLTATTRQILTLLTANGFIADTIKSGNQLTKLNAKRWPEKPRKAPADFPELQIEIPRNLTTNPNAAPTFANTTGVGCDRIVIKEVRFLIVVTWDSLDRAKPNQLACIIEAILLRNPTLGMTAPTVQSVGRIECEDREENAPQGNGVKRLVQRFTIPVVFRLRGSDLAAAAAATSATFT